MTKQSIKTSLAPSVLRPGSSDKAAVTLASSEQVQILPGLLFRDDSVIADSFVTHEVCSKERLLGLMRQAQSALPEAAVERLFEDVARFAGSAPQSDDITVAALYWKGNLP